jgi:DNA-binding FadR family transcriptional regulator
MNASFDGKLASVVAGRIAREILARGWCVGARLGVEPVLLKRFGVSREPFREAVRILEWQGIVRAERGARGGLIIQAPTLDCVAGIVKTYLELADVSYDEVREAHTLLLMYGLEMAVARMTPSRANGIRKVLRARHGAFRSHDEEGFAIALIYNAIIDAANNPGLTMLDFMFARLTADFGHQERYPAGEWSKMISRVWSIAHRMGDRAADRDLKGAVKSLQEERQFVDRTVKRLEQYNHRVWNTRTFLGGDYNSAIRGRGRTNKAATGLLYRMTATMRRSRMLPGTVLGTEGQLLRKFGVSRAVFREALRSLEFFGVATVKRGGGGGVAVSLPNPTATVDTAVLYLKYLRPDDVELRAFQRRLESDAIRLAAVRASHSELIALVEATRLAIRSAGEESGRLLFQASRRLIGLAENQALEFVVTLLSTAAAERGANAVGRPSVRRKQIIKRACLAVESATAGKSSGQLGQALHGLYAAMASNDRRI